MTNLVRVCAHKIPTRLSCPDCDRKAFGRIASRAVPKPHICLVQGMWEVFAMRDTREVPLLIEPAIKFCNRLNREKFPEDYYG